jgi:hypothetical protein
LSQYKDQFPPSPPYNLRHYRRAIIASESKRGKYPRFLHHKQTIIYQPASIVLRKKKQPRSARPSLRDNNVVHNVRALRQLWRFAPKRAR